MTAGDWNGDGKLDLAAGNSGADNVTILLNNASCETGNCLRPVFTQPSGSPVVAGSFLRSVASGDFDRDGDLDLAVASRNTNSVLILLGDGSGQFSAAPGSPVTVGTSPFSVASGDLNGDGALDLAVANEGSNTISILLGGGSGQFSAAPGSPIFLGAGTAPAFVAIVDVNRDGRLDLALANHGNQFVLKILLGDGSGGFSIVLPSFLGTGEAFSLAVGDWNGDGKLDVAVANATFDNVRILQGDGSGGFSEVPGSPVTVGNSPRSIAAGDLNGDGKLDLAVANNGSNNVSLLLGDGSGGFIAAPGSPVAVGVAPGFVAVGDLNGDGKLDLATANSNSSNVTILMGNGSGGFIAVFGSPSATIPISLAVGDLNRDGRLDLAATSSFFQGRVTILLNSATSTASDGTACNDSNASTTSDACSGGICSGPVRLPAEVDAGVQVAKNGDDAVISWNRAVDSTSSAVLRGLVSALPVGPGGGDEVCLASGPSSTALTLSDATTPALGASFWYLVRGDNECAKGPLGFQAQNGVPTVPRVSATCP